MLRVPRHRAAFAVQLLAIVAVVSLGSATARAQEAPQATFRLATGQPHAEVPFILELVLEGFEESPAPTQPALTIAGSTVQPVDVQPSISQSIQIINGRRSDIRRVTWVMRWQVITPKAGPLHVPSVTMSQGSRSATAQSGDVTVEDVATTTDMKVAMQLPARPVFVGETVPVSLVWLFRRQPENQTFAIPLASSDAFTISAPPTTDPRHAIKVQAGPQELALPYELDTATVDGVEYNRLTLSFFAAPRRAGSIALTPAAVVAELQTGRADFFGNAPTKMYRASDVPRTLEVKPLPETGKPPGFAGAVGEQFSIAVRTSRSVVQTGEPFDLTIDVKSDQRLDTLSLGDLAGPGGLPKTTFSVPAEAPTGVLAGDGKTKTFTVTAQVTGPATEVPALAFSYFDPAKETYQTIHSEPIALSVKGGTVVGAADVVAATPTKPGGTASPAPLESGATGPVGAALALSSPADASHRPLGGALLWGLVAMLYAVPVGLLVLRSYRHRTSAQREDAAEVRTARKRVEDLLDRAATAPARDIAGPLAQALRDLARLAGVANPAESGLLARLETEAFAPSASATSLSAELRSDAAGLMRTWIAGARATAGRTGRGRSTAVITLMGVVALGAGARTAAASALEEGRTAYREAMDVSGDATARRAAFSRAEVALGEAVHATPDRPQLLADWGNAALGAGDVATATLAYRRALAIDGNTDRARANLAWLRERQPDAFRPPLDAGATDTLLFFHHWPRQTRMLVGALAFALGILLLVPWGARRHRSLAAVAVLPGAVWLAMIGSLLVEDRHPNDAVVVAGVVMRAADSGGAPPALAQPLPLGAEVAVLEQRDSWTHIRVANGSTGWVQTAAIQRVAQ